MKRFLLYFILTFSGFNFSLEKFLNRIEQLPQAVQKYCIQKFLFDKSLIYTPEFLDLSTKVIKVKYLSKYDYLISSDNKFLLTNYGGHIRIINLITGKLWHTIKHDSYIGFYKLSYDNKFLVTCSNDKTAQITDLNSKQTLLTINHDDYVKFCDISSDDRLVLTGSYDGTAKVTDINTKQVIYTINHDSCVFFGAINIEEQFAVTGSYSDAKITDLNTGQLLYVINYNNLANLSINHDKTILIIGMHDCSVHLFNLITGELLHTINYDVEGSDSYIKYCLVSVDKKFVVTCCNNIIKITDLNTKELINTIAGNSLYAISLDNRLLFNISGSIKVVDLNNMQELYSIQHNDLLSYYGLSSIISNAKFSSDDKLIITCSNKGIKINDSKTGRLIHFILNNVDSDFPIEARMSANNRFLIIFSYCSIKIIDLEIQKFEQLQFLQIIFINWLYTQKSQNKAIYNNPDLKIKINKQQKLMLNSLPEDIKKSLYENYNLKKDSSCTIM